MQKLFHLQHILFVALLTWCVQVSAQNPNFTYTNTLLDVTFENMAFPTGIAKDDGSGYFTAPEWSSRGESPVAYVSGTKVKVKARFKFTCKPTGTVYVQGVNRDGYDLPPVALTFTSDTEGVYEGEAKTAFPVNVVNAFDPFRISWQASTDVNLPYTEMGTSANPLYVLYGIPNKFTTPFYTSIHVGCKNAAGQSEEDKIVDNIYKEFTDQCVERAERAGCMSYWGANSHISVSPVLSSFFTTAGLLANGEARCNAWAKFFIDMIRLQGLRGAEQPQLLQLEWTRSHYLEGDDNNNIDMDATANQIEFGSLSRTSIIRRAGFFVNKWNIQGRIFVDCFITTTNSPNQLISSPNIDIIGLSAQNNNNPWAFFEEHLIVLYNNKYYDPSYGTTISDNLAEWKDKSIAGFGSYGKIQRQDLSVVDQFWIKKVNDNDPDILEEIKAY